MSYTVTQEDLNILRQGKQTVYIRVELCGPSFKLLDTLEGVVLSDNFSVDSSAQQRREYRCDLTFISSSFDIGRDKKIWMDKRLRVYYGVHSLRTGEIHWYRIGTFAYVDVSYSFTQTERKISLSCADLMSQYNGTLNGQLKGFGSSNSNSSLAAYGLRIPAGEDIRKSIIATLEDAQIDSYIVEDIQKEIPYDLEFDTGATYGEVWEKICGLYDTWEYFFDADGTFIWRTIPTCLDDPVSLSDHILQRLVIPENTSSSFSGIYNVTEVWGRVLELTKEDRYADSSTCSDNVYSISLEDYSSWDDIDNLTKIGVKICSENLDSPAFSINGLNSIPIVDGDGLALKAGVLKAENIYVFRYRKTSTESPGKLFLLGQFQCYGRYEENSPSCPFSIPNLGYEIVKSEDCSGLSDDAACYNQAQYDTYKTTAMMDTISLEMQVIPWLEVNTKWEYTPQHSRQTGQYIVKSFHWSVGTGTMNVTLYKFSEDFSFIYNRKKR